MTNDPTLEELHHDDNEPATKGDVREAVGELAQAVKVGFDKTATKDDITNLKTAQERILSIVQSIDEHFKEHRELPEKVERLEEDVFQLKTSQR